MEIFYISDRNQIGQIVTELTKVDEIGLDTEANSLDTFTALFLLLQLEVNNKIFVLDVRKLGKEIIKYIVSVIKDSNKTCIGHNIKYDQKIIYNNTGESLEKIFDTMIAETLILQGVGKQYYSYQELVDKYFHVLISKEDRETFYGYTGEITNSQINYSGIDVRYLKGIKEKQIDILKNQGQEYIYELEMEVEPVVNSMELNGVLIDVDYLRNLSKDAEIKSLEKKDEILNHILSKLNYKDYKNAYELTQALSIPVNTKKLRLELESIGDFESIRKFIKNNININSPKQIKTIFNLLGIPIESTGEEVLSKLVNKYEICKLVLEYREQAKRISTYGENIISEIHPKTGRFHAEFNQVGTTTGRFAVGRLHQIPGLYRKAFIARPNYKILTVDYSQQEFRLAGAISGEQRIIDAYLQGKDMHIATAGLLYDKKLDDISKKERNEGKTVNFAVLYGSTKWGLARNLDIPLDDGERILEIFWKGYPRLYEFKLAVEKEILKHKYSVTPLGRKRYFQERELFADNWDFVKYQSNIKREGFNHIIQGSGSDVMKIAMKDIFNNNPFGNGLLFYLQVHDEIVLEISENNQKEIKEYVKYYMLKAEQPLLGEIPAEIDLDIKDYWIKG